MGARKYWYIELRIVVDEPENVWHCSKWKLCRKAVQMPARKTIFERISVLGFPRGQYVVVGSGVLEAHGIREANDLDIVVLPALFNSLLEDGWQLDGKFEQKWGSPRLVRGKIEIHDRMMYLNKERAEIDIHEVIATADLIQELPFQNLRSLLRCKQNALREKDAQDVLLITSFLQKQIGSIS